MENDAGQPDAGVAPGLVESEVDLLYRTILGRAPDGGGLAHYVAFIESGQISLSEAADDMIASQEFRTRYGTPDDYGVLDILVRNAFGNQPAPGQPGSGVIASANSDAAGPLTRGEVAVAVALDPAAQAHLGVTLGTGVVIPDQTGRFEQDPFSFEGIAYLVDDALLGGDATALDLGKANAELRGGTSAEELAGLILDSEDYTNLYGSQTDEAFLRQLYGNALERTPDAGGLQHYEDQLESGRSRAAVAAEIALSPEHLAVTRGTFGEGIYVSDPDGSGVARLYNGILGRAPDVLGFEGYVDLVGEGYDTTALAQQFADSDEYRARFGQTDDQAFVTDLYANALGRAPDPGGLSGYLALLASGESRGAVALDITQSDEAQRHLSPVIEGGLRITS